MFSIDHAVNKDAMLLAGFGGTYINNVSYAGTPHRCGRYQIIHIV